MFIGITVQHLDTNNFHCQKIWTRTRSVRLSDKIQINLFFKILYILNGYHYKAINTGIVL